MFIFPVRIVLVQMLIAPGTMGMAIVSHVKLILKEV